MKTVNVTVYRGDTTTISFQYDATKTVSDAWLYVRPQPDGSLLVKIRYSDASQAGQWTFNADGTAQVTLLGTDTAPVPPGVYMYDIQVDYSDGTSETVQRGAFILEGDISTDLAADSPPNLEAHVTLDQRAALDAADSPSSTNPIVTVSRLLAQTLAEHGDVDVTGLADGMALVWDATAGKWKPVDVATQAELDAHVNDTSNPHQVTASQVGAVPATGGTFTGPIKIEDNAGGVLLHIRSVGSAAILIEADVDNANEYDLPYIEFRHDGQYGISRIGVSDPSDPNRPFSDTEFNVFYLATNQNSMQIGKIGYASFVELDFLNNIMTAKGTVEFEEIADPGPGAANTARLYCRDDGTGKTQLVVQFGSGAPIVLATEA